MTSTKGFEQANPKIEVLREEGSISSSEDSFISDLQKSTQSELLARIERSFELRESLDRNVSLVRIRGYMMRYSEKKAELRDLVLKTQTAVSKEIRENVLQIVESSLEILIKLMEELRIDKLQAIETVSRIRASFEENLTPAIAYSKMVTMENVILKASLARAQEELAEHKEQLALVDAKLHIDYVSGLPNRQAFIEDFHNLLIQQLNQNVQKTERSVEQSEAPKTFSVLSLKLVDDPNAPATTRFLPDDLSLNNYKKFIQLIKDFFREKTETEEVLSAQEIGMEALPMGGSGSLSEDPYDLFIDVDLSESEECAEEEKEDYSEKIERNRRLSQEMMMMFATISTENVDFIDLMAQENFQYREAFDEWQKDFDKFRIYRYGAGNLMVLLRGSINENRDLVFGLREKIIDNAPLFDVNMSLAAFSDTSINSISQKFEETNSPQIVQNSMDTIFSLLSMGQHFAEKFGKDNVNIAVNNSICVFGDDEVSSDSSQEGKFDPFKAVLMPENQFKARCAQNNADMFLRVYNAVRAGKMKKRK